MTDPNQNTPQGPEGPGRPQGPDYRNPYAPGPDAPGPGHAGPPPWQPAGPGQPGGPGQPWYPDPQQNPYARTGAPGLPGPVGHPGQPGRPGQSGGSGKAVAVIVGAVVVVVIVAAVLVVALRSDDDTDEDTADGQSVTSVPLDDTFTDGTDPGNRADGPSGSGDGGSGGAGSGLSPQWAALVPVGIADHLEHCYETSFDVHYIDSDEDSFEIDGNTCYATGPALDGQQVDILGDAERVGYLEDTLAGNQGASTAQVFTRDGTVTVGVADIETAGPTLYYLDSASDLSVEVMSFSDTGSARAAAQELGIL